MHHVALNGGMNAGTTLVTGMKCSRKKFPGAHVVHIRSGNHAHLIWTNSPRDRYAEEKLAAEMEVEVVSKTRYNQAARETLQVKKRTQRKAGVNMNKTPIVNYPLPATGRMTRSVYKGLEEANNRTTPMVSLPTPILNAPSGPLADNPRIKPEPSEPSSISSIPSNSNIHPSRSQNFNHPNPPPEPPLPSQPEENPLLQNPALESQPPRPEETALPTPPQRPSEDPSFDLPLSKPFHDVSNSTSETIPELQRQVEYWREKAEMQTKQIAHQKELRVLKDREIAALRELLATAEEKVKVVEMRNTTALNALGSKF